MLSVFTILVAAHVLSDFVLQTNGMVRRKRLWWMLAAHAGIHAVLAYALLQHWSVWQVPVLVFILHGLIDAVKMRFPPSPRGFVADQVAHVVSLLLPAVIAHELAGPFTGQGWTWIVGAAGFAASVWGVGYFVGEIAARIIAENLVLREQLKAGLQDGGKRIGQLERALIFAMILAGEPSGIGFLVAAKSILRFEEAKKLPVAEYVLIGTFWSFGLALVIAWGTRRLVLGGVP